ncbi:MAG: spore cortex biosynthesis protein YabQ [Lachnospiraceae bacterium]|nr:spore cortex biosynthesis protein YabQ [Lachnospiraceae bacterium]
MISMVYGEWELLRESIRIGLLLSLLYDGIKIIRIFLDHPALIRDLEDALYWVISTLLILELQFEEGGGIFRGFSIVAVFLTMLLYHKILSPFWISPLERWIERLKIPLTKVTKMLRIKLKKQMTCLMSNRREHGKKKSSGSKKKTKHPGNHSGHDGSVCYDAGSNGK